MPAAKKTTKKPTKTLKTNNVTGRKKILLISVLVLVVIGVAAIVRSFAATGDIIFSAGNNNILPVGGASIVVDSNDKSGAKIVQLPKGGSVITAAYYAGDGSKTCAMVRADANIANGVGVTLEGSRVGGGAGGSSPIGVSTTWTEVCPNGNPQGNVQATVRNSTNTKVYVSYIVYKPGVTTPVVTPTVSPTTSKNGGK